MTKLGGRLIFTGIFAILLGGLEKILIFISFRGQGITQSRTLLDFTPSVVWNVTIATRNFGIFLLVIGVIFYFSDHPYVRKTIETMKQRSEEYKRAIREEENARD